MDFKGETAPYFGEWTVVMGGQALCGKVFPAGAFEEGVLSHKTQCAILHPPVGSLSCAFSVSQVPTHQAELPLPFKIFETGTILYLIPE